MKQEDDVFICLKKIRSFFEFLKNKDVSEKAKDREIYYIDIIKLSEQDHDFLYSLSQLDEKKLEKMSEGSILSCNQQTTKEDIESFIDRTRNIDEEFVILGYQNLSLEHQTFIIDKINYYLNEKKLKIKICLVGDSAKEKIFKYFSNLSVRKNIAGKEDLSKQSKAYDNFIKERLGIDSKKKYGEVKIFRSAYEGLGKTHQIL